ncbi:MAG: hypothetical protein AAFZ74_06015 [Pseudomonadota bacterium]
MTEIHKNHRLRGTIEPEGRGIRTEAFERFETDQVEQQNND